MKIVKWDHCGNDSYPDLENTSTKEEICEAWDVLVGEIRENGYFFNGTYHQQGDYGAPVYDNGKMYRLSFREWGQIMLEAHPLDVDTYSEFAWGDIAEPGFKYPIADKSDVPKRAMIIQPISGKTYKEIAETRDRAIKALKKLGYEVIKPIINDKWAEKRRIKDDTLIEGWTLHYFANLLLQMSYCDVVCFTENWECDAHRINCLMRIAALHELKIIYEEEIKEG